MKDSNKPQSPIIVCGNARFTVINPNCIRLEYQQEGKFIDAPSWFAINRLAGCKEFTVEENSVTLKLETAALLLAYQKTEKPFSRANLTIKLKMMPETVWHFGEINRHNLGGTLQTLDGVAKPRPLPEGLLSRDGWYYIDDSHSHLFSDDWIESRSDDTGSDGYFFGYGTDYKTALASLTAIGGAVPLPRKYILGSWYSRWHAYTSDDYKQIVAEYDEHDFPLDIMVMDMDWHRKEDAEGGYGWANMPGWTGWSWNRELISDPNELLTWYHDRDLHVTLNVHPHDSIRKHEDCYEAFMAQLGEDPADGKTIPFKAGDKTYMDAYFKAAHEPLEDQGVDFWWVDWQQDSIMPYAEGLEKMRHLPLLNYCYYTHGKRNNKRGLSFSRWAGWGDHRYPIHFSGDAVCNWDMLAYEVDFTAAAGNVGCFFWSHDIGGFHGERNPETYARWVQFGITTAALRLHSTGDELDRRPWKWGEQMTESMRRSFHLRSKLIPYIYSSMDACYQHSLPLNRPMYLEYPEYEAAYQTREQFLLGDSMLVAPIVMPGQGDNFIAERQVWLPPGVWYNWFNGERFEGDRVITVKADINEFPLFVRGGHIIPMQPYSKRMTAQKLNKVTLRCFHAVGTVKTSLYEDDGLSEAYQTGACCRTTLVYEGATGSARLTIEPLEGEFDGMIEKRQWQFELACPKVKEVSINEQNVPWQYDESTQTLAIQIQDMVATRQQQTVTIAFH